jgi:hypothetical protein
MIYDFEKYKMFESLPRQSTVDQLKRIRKEIMNDRSSIKVGPITTKSERGDIGDKMTRDMKKHNLQNLILWDNPLDRKICSYEDFVANDSKKGLGYTPTTSA